MTLKQWLISCEAYGVRWAKVTIDGQEWKACYYYQKFGGENGVPRYERKGLYCIGALPKSYHPNKENKICYPWGKDGPIWYVGGYITSFNITESNKEFHPFGEHFILFPWSLHQPIDYYENKPYVRKQMEVVLY